MVISRLTVYSLVSFLVGILVCSLGYSLAGDFFKEEVPVKEVVLDLPIKKQKKKKFPPADFYQPAKKESHKFEEVSKEGVSVLPEYMKSSLEELGIKSNFLDEATWKALIAKAKAKGVTEFKKKHRLNLLDISLLRGHLPSDEMLAQHGYDLSKDTPKTRYFLTAAVQYLTLRDIKKLVAKGVNLNFDFSISDLKPSVFSSKRENLLNYALRGSFRRFGGNNSDVIEYLIEQGLSVDKGEDYILDALKGMKKSGPINSRYFQEILNKTDPNVIERRKPLMADILLLAPDKVIGRLLDKFKFPEDEKIAATVLCNSAFNKNISKEQFSRLIDMAKTPDLIDFMGRTPLMVAVSVNNYDQVKVLLEKGANVGAKNKFNQTTVIDYLNNERTHKYYDEQDRESMRKLLVQYSKRKG